MAFGAAWVVLLTVVPGAWWATNGLKKKSKGRAASLTVEGKTVKKK